MLLAGGAVWFRIDSTRAFFDPHALLSRFPAEDALAVGIDVAALRRSGLLGASTMRLEPEYKEFLDGTGFDYRRDLDSVTASFAHSGNYFIARGRFNWAKLREYVAHSGGSCYRDLCRVQGSRPERRISFVPLRESLLGDDAIALAVSTNDLAATLLMKTGQPITTAIPSAPVWISVPGSELGRQSSLPEGMRLMLSSLRAANRVLITLGPGAHGIEAHMEATCRTQDDARALASQLRATTSMLKQALTHESNPASDEVANLLVAGSFDHADRRVTGTWPVKKSLLDALTSGI